jgi:hypothetical protein
MVVVAMVLVGLGSSLLLNSAISSDSTPPESSVESSAESSNPSEVSQNTGSQEALASDSVNPDGVAGGADKYRRPVESDIPMLTSTKDSKKLFDSIKDCFTADPSRPNELFDQAPCYEEEVNAAALVMEPHDLLNAVKALVAARPDVLSACHDGGHSAASILTKRLWNPKDSYEEQLKQMRFIMDVADDVCQNGYVHGFYDSLGKNNPNEDSLKAAGQVCYEMARFALDCGHGLGHTAWNSTLDFSKAATVCGMFEAPYRYGCDDGVIMYIPDLPNKDGDIWAYDPTKPEFNAEKFYKDAVDVCSWWPKERGNDPEPLRGCWVGIVSGLLWRPITTLSKYGVYEDYKKEIDSLHKMAEKACMSLGKDGEEYCINEWPGMVIYMVENEPDMVPTFCAPLVKYKERCIKDTLDQMKMNEEFDTEMSRR